MRRLVAPLLAASLLACCLGLGALGAHLPPEFVARQCKAQSLAVAIVDGANGDALPLKPEFEPTVTTYNYESGILRAQGVLVFSVWVGAEEGYSALVSVNGQLHAPLTSMPAGDGRPTASLNAQVSTTLNGDACLHVQITLTGPDCTPNVYHIVCATAGATGAAVEQVQSDECPTAIEFSEGVRYFPAFNPGFTSYYLELGPYNNQTRTQVSVDYTWGGQVGVILNGLMSQKVDSGVSSGELVLASGTNTILVNSGSSCPVYQFTASTLPATPPEQGGQEQPPPTQQPPTEEAKCTSDLNDLVALNYALTLEHLEATFYTDLQKVFTANDFISQGYTQLDYDRFTLIGAHERAHVEALQATISARGGEPVPACTYKFAVTDVMSYVATAKLLENTGVSAYDGAISAISDPGLQQVAATIATVEARHAAFLNELVGTSPFPNATDMPKTPSEIAAAITPLLDTCNYTLVLPAVRPGGVAFSTSEPEPPAASPYLLRGTYTKEQLENDLVALNYALTLEHLEAAFYVEGLAQFSMADFTAANYSQNVYDNYVLIGAHETAHVEALTSIITGRGGEAVPACAYAFNITDVANFVATSKLLENTGVSAYDGAVNTIADTGLQVIAATVATVEARHASYINRLTGDVPFPDAVDTAISPDDIVKAVSPLITSCPYTIATPKVADPAECVKESCKLASVCFGEGVSFHPAFHPAVHEYTCACSQDTFLTSVQAQSMTDDGTLQVKLFVNGKEVQTLGVGEQSASYELKAGKNKAVLEIKGMYGCLQTYTFYCTRFSAPAGTALYNWRTGAYSACSAECDGATTGTRSGNYTRTVQCENDAMQVVGDSFCKASSHPEATSACSVSCGAQQMVANQPADNQPRDTDGVDGDPDVGDGDIGGGDGDVTVDEDEAASAGGASVAPLASGALAAIAVLIAARG